MTPLVLCAGRVRILEATWQLMIQQKRTFVQGV